MISIQENISLKKFNSFGIEARAANFAIVKAKDEIEEILKNSQKRKDLLVLGGGSNLLLTKNLNGLVLKNEISGLRIIKEDEHYVYVKTGAGESWQTFIDFCLQHNLAGAENLSLIPGSVGASPMQNIGAYGVELKDIFHSLEAYHLQEHSTVYFTKLDCAFGYRESIFKNKLKGQFIITNVIFQLNKIPVINTTYGAINAELEKMGVKDPGIKEVSKAVSNIRRSKLPDPAVLGNAGSFFKNPEVKAELFSKLKNLHANIVGYELANGNTKLAAGWLIEQCGWKGFRRDDAGCYEKQALILVNYGAATGREIYDLSTEIIQSVQDKFGVELEREVNIV